MIVQWDLVLANLCAQLSKVPTQILYLCWTEYKVDTVWHFLVPPYAPQISIAGISWSGFDNVFCLCAANTNLFSE